jgi:two-component system, NarL family, sensor histidine kinase UhpB
MVYKIKLIFLISIFIHIQNSAQNRKLDSLLNQLKNQKDDTNKVNTLRNIGVAYANDDPRKAIQYWKKGVELSRKLKYIKGLARNFINIGTGYSYISLMDSTLIYADSGIKYSKIIGDPERLALVYLNKGDAFRNLGDYKSTLIYCDTASKYANKTKNIDRQARIYDIISDIYLEQKQYTTAKFFQEKALNLYRKDGNLQMEGQAYDDISTTYQIRNQLDSALIFRKKAVEIGEKVKDTKNLSTYYYGMADIYFDYGNYNKSSFYANKSLNFAKQQANNNQLASTYTLISKINLKIKNYIESIKNGLLAYNYAKMQTQIGQEQSSAAILAEAYTAIKDFKNAYNYLVISNTIKDSLTEHTFNSQVAGLQSNFEIKEKDKEIKLLATEKELQSQKLNRQRIIMFGSGGLIILAAFGLWQLFNRRKLKEKLHELELRNQIAADLHDEVGSSLSSIQMLSQLVANQPNIAERDRSILEKMTNNSKETMEKMSDIVWMIKPGENDAMGLFERMKLFLQEICSGKNIENNFKKEGIEGLELSMTQRKNIYLIFKEAVNNAAKYSDTKRIDIEFTKNGNQLLLSIIDFGKGFDIEHIRRGNGLENMQNRAKELGGKLTLESEIGVGTKVRLVI